MVEAVAALAAQFRFPLVVDPVMISKHGAPLMTAEAREAVVRHLLPVATLVTPNLEEAAVLTGLPVTNVSQMREAAARLCELGAKAALVKGGHLGGSATDVLFAGGSWYEFPAPRIDTPHTHGTGCTYSAAITAALARGAELPEAVRIAKDFINDAIRTASGLGHGHGPVNHFAEAAIST